MKEQLVQALKSKNSADFKTQKEVNVPYGSILIFNQCLLHKSGINKSNNCRISIQLRYNSFKKNDEILSSFEAKSTDHVINNQSHVLKN